MSDDKQKAALESRVTELKDLFGQYLRAFGFYLVIQGGLLKFTLDANATPELSRALSIFGIGVCILGLVVIVMGFRILNAYREDITALWDALDQPHSKGVFLPIRYTCITSAAFVGILLTGWIYISIAVWNGGKPRDSEAEALDQAQVRFEQRQSLG